jgi:ATP-dependent DNA helicase PIF1
MASSGIASLLLEGGRTAHFKLKIPLKCNRQTTCDIKSESNLAKLIQQSKLFIWDEAPMLDKYVYETVDRTFRDIMKEIDSKAATVPFGGKIMIFGGDFRQTLPIVKHGNRSKIVSSCINRSYLWHYMKIYTFTINKRIELSSTTHKIEKKQFNRYLMRIGAGTEPNFKELGDDIIKLPNDICMPMTDSLDLINVIYNNFERNYEDIDYLMNRVILTTTNRTADKINEEVLTLLPTQQKIYYSADSNTSIDEVHNYPVEFLNMLNFTGMPPHELKLKINAVIICVRNLNTAKGLCNGTRLIVRNFKQHVIEAEILTGTHKGETVFLPRITLSPNEEDVPFDFKRRQFPIKLAFSLTVNKSQGQTIKKVGFYVDGPLF